MANSNPSAQATDVRPYLVRDTDNPISRAERVRDQISATLKNQCRELGIEAQIADSTPFSASVWVKIVIWRRTQAAGSAAGRSYALVTIEPRPFHRCTQELELEYEFCGRKRVVRSLAELTESNLRELILYIGGFSGLKPQNLQRFRQYPWQLWRKKNKVDVIRKDYLGTISVLLLVAGAQIAGVWNPWSGAMLILTGIAGLVYLWREPHLVLTTGKPSQEPRDLVRMDSWQTALRGAAEAESDLRARLSKEIDDSRPTDSTFTDENIWYWGIDGKEERRQFVITFRRALAFVQIYAYHRDLYVSWDTHVNRGTWGEYPVAQGIDAATGRRISANSIRFAWHVPNEYDIADASYLSEWIHALVVERVKETIEERKISQEIDFRIQREERRGVAGAQQVAKPRRNFFKRVG
jgi:hypothetical protein